jgi:glycogen operon protein
VTTVELMPVHQFLHDHHLVERGLRNYWGYNSVGYLAPHNGYAIAADTQITEFKAMVKSLHAAGIEVIMDVVYNHTAEGNHMGPIISMRGIDNLAYYRVTDANPRHYLDFTGTGNSLNMRNPHVLQLIMDSLRYWVTEMHVDGFRFDLASTLARELFAVDRLSAFFDLVQQDPVVSSVKLIAEPWDVGDGGYQVGNFPPLWSEWNGRYRDTIRDFWRGEPAALAEFGSRFTGSSDLYQDDTRRPTASINFVTAHDGFTLADLVSYNEKHNAANGEDNRDGESHNRSWNCGVEGPTDDPDVNALRARQRRNMMTTLLLSQGVPMLLGGDELGRTQRGNNNAYCQDSELSWYDWQHVDTEFVEWCRSLTALRKAHPVFRRRRWFQRHAIRGTEEVHWVRPDGESMDDDDWDNGYARSVGVLFNGEAISTPDAQGGRVVDDSFLLLFNASEIDLPWRLPQGVWPRPWTVELDTSQALAAGTPFEADGTVEMVTRSMVVLRSAPMTTGPDPTSP